MPERFDTIIRIDSEHGEIVVEQKKEDGVIARKNISSQALIDGLVGSRYDDACYATGLQPEGCVATVMGQNVITYFIRYPELCADISYYGTEYLKFPIPRLVFGFKYLPKEGKVAGCRLCVVKDEKLIPDTPTYCYPFSNVGSGGHICTGNNALPMYREPSRLHTLAGYILRLPNNDDQFQASHNRLLMGYRDLLELLKDKSPEFYYTDILVKDGKTLKDFLNGR